MWGSQLSATAFFHHHHHLTLGGPCLQGKQRNEQARECQPHSESRHSMIVLDGVGGWLGGGRKSDYRKMVKLASVLQDLYPRLTPSTPM